MNPEAVRRGAGLFRDLERGVVRVSGSDRVRWLNGMLTNDVAGLDAATQQSGCRALLLSRNGRIVADTQVLERGDSFWLDVDSAAVDLIIETLERFIIADAVTLEDCRGEFDRFALCGPATPAILARLAPSAAALAPDANVALEVGGHAVVAARFGWTGEESIQFFAPAGTSAELAALMMAGPEESGLVDSDSATLEVLRIEAGVPRFGAELDDTVLPAEAGLESAISTVKGCYTGQEVVERMRSQGAASHRLVGVTAASLTDLAVGSEITAGGKRVGEITSACMSETAGPIALAFVRSAFAEPLTEVEVAGGHARIAALPFSVDSTGG